MKQEKRKEKDKDKDKDKGKDTKAQEEDEDKADEKAKDEKARARFACVNYSKLMRSMRRSASCPNQGIRHRMKMDPAFTL